MISQSTQHMYNLLPPSHHPQLPAWNKKNSTRVSTTKQLLRGGNGHRNLTLTRNKTAPA